MKSLLCSFLLLFCSLLLQAKEIELYVSTTGNDSYLGSVQKPFKTIEKAIASASVIHTKKVVIYLRGGTYYLSQTIVLDQKNMLPEALEIVAFGSEKVTISAGRQLLLHWQSYKNGIFKAVVPTNIFFERLYVNGQLQVLARYPNYNERSRVFHGTASDAIFPERVMQWANPIGGYVHALHEGEWGGFHYRISGVTQNGTLQLDGGWQNNRPAPMHKQYRFVENIFEELDTVGEWWFDKNQHEVYYYPPKGLQFSNALIEVSNLKNSIELHGTAAQPLKNIKLQNLQFAHNERSFMFTQEPLLRSDWTIYRGAALLLDGTENCKVDNCNFSSIGGNAIMLSNYNRFDTISNNLIEYIGANAVCLVGDPKAVRSPLFSYESFQTYQALDKQAGPLNNNYPQQCLVSNNLMHHLGEIEKQATGVEIEMSSRISVINNSIYNTPRAGINIGDGCWGGHEIAYNDVFKTVLETGDHGAFNSWGRDRYWSADRAYMDSLVQVHPELVLLDAIQQTSIHDNRFRCDHGWDIDLDDGSSNYAIYNNICLNGGLKLREGFYRIVTNNVLINNSFHPHVWFKKSFDVFAHNIVGKKYFPIQITDWGNKIDSNFFPDKTSLQEAQQNGTDANSVAGDITCTNPSKANYTVASSSPALQVGFHNFPMNKFGVQTPRLKKLALQAPVPTFISHTNKLNGSIAISFMGGLIKSVETMGERSAYGLPSANGVIVINAGKNSLLSQSGLKEKDVIVIANNQLVTNAQVLEDIYQSAIWKDKIEITVYRNQQRVPLILLLK